MAFENWHINNDVKAMMAEALAEWIDGDVGMTRSPIHIHR